MLAGDEIPLLRPGDARHGLGGRPESLQAALWPTPASYQDVYDLANEMIGELNASHTGVSGPAGPDGTSRPTGPAPATSGFEMAPDKGLSTGSRHIYRDGPADKEWLKLKAGRLRLRHRRNGGQGR